MAAMRVNRAKNKKVTKPEHLSQSAVGVIGLWSMGVLDSARIAKLLCRRTEEIEAFADVLRNSENRLVAEYVACGLPAGVSAKLRYATVRCPKCGREAERVPCQTCARPEEEPEPEVDETSKKRRLPRPTNAVPGTGRKVNVLRQRHDRGQELWHPDDAPYIPWKGI